eukprot:5875386-Ditylum_brightwellii.AAC.1
MTLGASEESYSHCQLYPIYGSGQGATNSPTIWLVHQVVFVILGFIDDVPTQVNMFCNSNITVLQLSQ